MFGSQDIRRTASCPQVSSKTSCELPVRLRYFETVSLAVGRVLTQGRSSQARRCGFVERIEGVSSLIRGQWRVRSSTSGVGLNSVFYGSQYSNREKAALRARYESWPGITDQVQDIQNREGRACVSSRGRVDGILGNVGKVLGAGCLLSPRAHAEHVRVRVRLETLIQEG